MASFPQNMILPNTLRLELRTHTSTPTILQSNRRRLRHHIQVNTGHFARLVQTQQHPIMRFQTVDAQTTNRSVILPISTPCQFNSPLRNFAMNREIPSSCLVA